MRRAALPLALAAVLLAALATGGSRPRLAAADDPNPASAAMLTAGNTAFALDPYAQLRTEPVTERGVAQQQAISLAQHQPALDQRIGERRQGLADQRADQ